MNVLSNAPSLVVIDAAERTYAHYVGSKRTLKAVADDSLLTADQVESFRVDPHGYMGIPQEAA